MVESARKTKSRSVLMMRPGRVLLALMISILILSGCAKSENGQSVDAATASINAVEGLSGEAKFNGFYSGIVYDRWARVDVLIISGFVVQDTHGLLLWMAKTAWSMNEDEPNQGMTFVVKFEDASAYALWNTPENLTLLPQGMDIVATAQDDGNYFTTLGMYAQDSDDPSFRSWPGEVPTLPDNVVVKVADG